ncbi:MAG: PAS domain S-box protein [Syntrophobacteraceae bacterium]
MMMKKSHIVSAALVLSLLLAQPLYAAEPKETKRVLVLYGEDKAHPAHELTDQGIRAAFRSSQLFDVQLYSEYLDDSRFGGAGHARTVADYLRRKYTGIKIDTIITVYPSAIDFLMSAEGNIFPGLPTVASQVTRTTAENLEHSPLRRFITAVVTADNSAFLLDTALRLRPGTQHVALVAGVTPNDSATEQALRNAMKPHFEKLELIDLTKLPMQDILARVGSLPQDTIVLYSSIFKDGEGRGFIPREALSLVSRAANAPVFGLYESFLGYGIVGGPLVSFEHLGRQTAALALRILGGESPASIPFGGEEAYVSLYDWRELKRWNIPETAVPPGSEIRYREPSLWRDHKGTIAGMIAFMVFEAFLILVLVMNLRMRRRAERALIESEENVRLAVTSAGAGLWSFEMGTGHLWATDRTRELFGFVPDEALNYERFLGPIHPEDRVGVRQFVQQSAQLGQETRVEYRVVLPDGTGRWLASVGRFQKSSSGGPNRFMGVAVDITERKRIENALSESRAQILAVFDSTNDLIWSVDPVNFGVVTWNSALGDYFLKNWEIELRVGMTPEQLVPPEFVTTWKQFYSRALREGSFTTEYYVATGTIILLLSFNLLKRDGEVFGISVFGRDITERTLMEQQITAAAEEWQATFDSIQDQVMILDSEFRILRLNAPAVSFLGLPLSRTLGRRCHVLMHGTDESVTGCPVEMTFRTGLHAETEIFHEGKNAWLLVSADPIYDSTGKVQRVVHTAKDITERKQADEMLRQREKELMTLTGRLISTQEEELRRLSRELHDDLTQRLAVLAMDAGMIEQQLRPLKTQAAEETRDLKIKLIEVSEEVHDLSRQLHPSILDDLGLVQAVQSECAIFTKRAGIALSFAPRDVPDEIPNDIALCLYRVIQEGLRNIANHAKTNEARIALHGLDGGVDLLIQDFGVGFGVREVQGKPGIGLAGMRERVRLVGGKMSLRSEPGKGTEIQISIPLGGKHGQTARTDRR